MPQFEAIALFEVSNLTTNTPCFNFWVIKKNISPYLICIFKTGEWKTSNKNPQKTTLFTRHTLDPQTWGWSDHPTKPQRNLRQRWWAREAPLAGEESSHRRGRLRGRLHHSTSVSKTPGIWWANKRRRLHDGYKNEQCWVASVNPRCFEICTLPVVIIWGP